MNERKHVVVTGAGSGIGRAVAQRLAKDGYAVSLMGRTQASLTETRAMLQERGGVEARVVLCDIRDQGDVQRAFQEAKEELGPLFALVANAGIGGANAPGPDDRFEDLVATNLNGSYYSLRAAEQHLEPGPAGRHLLVVSSILARFGVPGYTGYCASKTALLGLVRALAMELASDNVQVNALCPGWVNTQMARDGIQGIADAMGTEYDVAYAEAMRAVPFGRMSEPEHIAGMVAWLLGPDAVGVTGQALDMNNGAFMS